MRLVLATANPHKLREFRTLLEPHEILALPEAVSLPPEAGETFQENALAKARAAAATDVPAVADDSGIEVAALGRAPGVRSARYAGPGATDEENLQRLLTDVGEAENREAAYFCVLALVWPDGRECVFEGRCDGRLANAPRGRGGFGYDPIFVPDDIPGERTMAELDHEEKNVISHRGRAARQLLDHLRDLRSD